MNVRAGDETNVRARWGPTDPFSRDAPEYADAGYNGAFVGALAYVRVFTKIRRRAARGTIAALAVVAESIADPETFSAPECP